MKKSALYIVPSWFTLNYHLRGHLSFMKAKGYNVTVAGLSDPRAEAAAKREGARYVAIDLDPSKISPLKDLHTVLRIVQLLKVLECNVIYCCTKKGALLGGLAGRLAGVPCIVYHVRGVRGLAKDTTHPLKKTIYRMMEHFVCGLAHRVVFTSRSNMEIYNGIGLLSHSKSSMFGGGSSNGIDTWRFRWTAETTAAAKELRNSRGIPDDAYVIGFVGRPVREKGIDELHTVWGIIRDKHDDTHLMIVSPPETDCPHIIDALMKDERVHFTGFMEEPVAAYAAMDCLLAPSHEIEGFANVALEAGSMEIPVVATRVTGLLDAVLNGETGLLVEPGDTVGLVEAVDRLISDNELSQRLGVNGRQRCIAHFRQDIIWDGFARLYEELATSMSDTGQQDGGGVSAERRKIYG